MHIVQKIFSLLFILAGALHLSGCLLTVRSIQTPASAAVGEEFSIVCDALISGTEAGSAGVLMEVPESFEITRAYLVTTGGTHVLKRNPLLEQTVPHEKGNSIIALTGSAEYLPVPEDSIRLLAYFRPKQTGTFPVKFIFGIPSIGERRTNWRSIAPENVYKFALINDTLNTDYLRFINVEKPEVNGTAAIELSGERQFAAFPDTGLLAFRMDAGFSIEFWTKTTDLHAVILSTRADDYASYFPFELAVDRFGNIRLVTADGNRVRSTENRAFISDGRWHHIAVSFTPSNSFMRLFVDATSVDSIFIEPPGRGTSAPSPLVLGGRATKMHFFKGILDEFRIWNVTRGEEEIAFYQNAVLSGFEDNLYLLLNFEESNNGVLENINPSNAVTATVYNFPKLIMSTAPLLAEVISFSAYVDDQAEDVAVLTWESFDDTEVQAYEVEKRTERGKFSIFQHVVPDSALGNHQVYRLTDAFDGKSVYFYRLRRINRDGSVYYSEVYPIGAEAFYNFVLESNKPDPFVSGTEITFTLNETAFVTLTVYDIMGREVEQLLAEKKRAGTYTLPFDGSEKPAGMYFYKLKTNAGSQTKKMYLSR